MTGSSWRSPSGTASPAMTRAISRWRYRRICRWQRSTRDFASAARAQGVAVRGVGVAP